jgi:hypothetical protein
MQERGMAVEVESSPPELNDPAAISSRGAEAGVRPSTLVATIVIAGVVAAVVVFLLLERRELRAQASVEISARVPTPLAAWIWRKRSTGLTSRSAKDRAGPHASGGRLMGGFEGAGSIPEG